MQIGTSSAEPPTDSFAATIQMEDGAFLAVPLDCLQPDLLAPCDLYLQVAPGSCTLYARQGLPFEQDDRSRLEASGISHLFLRQEDTEYYFAYMKKVVTSIVRDPCCKPEQKAKAIHSACQDILRRTFEDPRACFISQAHEMIVPTIDLIVSDDTAARHLVQLTAYDHYTYTHSTNVGIFSLALTRLLYGDNPAHDLQILGPGFFLHDLGKCQVPVEIITKPGPLDDDEWVQIKKHPKNGQQILAQTGYLSEEAETIILQHHEKDDGTGYPHSKNSSEIHPYARICRLADVYDALTSQRPYQQRRSTFEALKLMKEQIMVDMDQEFFNNFVRLFHP